MAHRERKFYDSGLAIELYDSAVSCVLSLCSRDRYRRREERGRGGFLYDDGHSEQQAAARQLYEEISFHQGRFGPFGWHGHGQPHHGRGTGRCKQVRRSEEHTSELQSRSDLVCRLLLE